MILIFLSCQYQEVEPFFLNVYIDDPSLYQLLSIYQKEVDSEPLNIHLRSGLETFFQMTGGERPTDMKGSTRVIAQSQSYHNKSLDESIPRLQLGGGLFLSRELRQLPEVHQYLERLPDRFSYQSLQRKLSTYSLAFENKKNLFSPQEQQTAKAQTYLTPLLLYPLLFEIKKQTNTKISRENPLHGNPALQNYQFTGLYRLLSHTWLKHQILGEPSVKTLKAGTEPKQFQLTLHKPLEILLEYLQNSPLQVFLWEDGIALNEESLPYQTKEFLLQYRSFIKRHTINAKIPRASQQELIQDKRLAKELEKNLQNAKKRFIQNLQQSYRTKLQRDVLFLHQNISSIKQESLEQIYFLGKKTKSQAGEREKIALRLQDILWAGISKGLNPQKQEKALQILTWLQSFEGQSKLQEQLHSDKEKSPLGINGALSLYPAINIHFWRKLHLNWGWHYSIEWQLADVLIQWSPTLFQDIHFMQEKTYRKHSAKSIASSFILPYLFLPEGRQLVFFQQEQEQAYAKSPQSMQKGLVFPLDWSLWLK